MPVTTIGKFKDEPERPAAPQYETLADVPEGVFVLAEVAAIGGRARTPVMFRVKDRAHFLTTNDPFGEHGDVEQGIAGEGGRPYSPSNPPSHYRVHSVLGRITAIQFDTDTDTAIQFDTDTDA